MGTRKYQNKTRFIRCPKDEEHPFNRVPASLYKLDGYQLAIMSQILSNSDEWKLVKKEIQQRVKFPRKKFNDAWDSLVELGYIKSDRIQGGWSYTIYDNLDFTTTKGGNCENLTYTTGALCEDGILTTTNKNYYTGATTTNGGSCHKEEFQELLKLYPTEVRRSDGNMRRLHTRTKDSERLYSEYLDSGGMTHDKVKTALIVELRDRQLLNTTKYQKNLYNWISDKTFETYKGRSIEPNKQLYGTELI